MALRFLIRTSDNDGYQYRIEIDRDGYSGSVTELTAGAPTFDIALGRNSPDVLWRPIEESSAQIRAVDDNAELEEIFDSGRREYSVNITRRLQDTSDAFVSVWRGFLRSDFYQDDPHNRSLVTLEAVDGLALLKQEQANIRLLPESYQAAVRRLLAEVGYELPARFAIPYYPSTIGSSSNIEKLDVRWEGLSEFTKYEALRSLMAAFGAQLKQSKGEWRIDTRTSLAREDAWRRYDTADVVTTGSLPDDVKPFTFNLDSFGQPVNTFRPATAAVQVTHDHERIPNLLLNAGFENGNSATDIDSWMLTQPDDGGSLVDRVSWDTTTVKDASQENEWVLRARRRAGGTPHYDGPILSQESTTQVQRGRGEILMQFIDGRADFTTPQRFRVRLETEDGFFLRTGTAQVLDSFLGSDGESGQLSIEAVDGAPGAVVAPAGARLPIRSGGSQEAHDATITLSEPWRVGDTTLIGEVSDSIDVDSVGPVDVLYYQWETTSGAVPGWEWPVAFGFTVGTSDREEDAEVRLRRQKWTLPTATVNGVSIGGRLTLTLEMVTASSISNPRESFFDDFRIQPLLDGREIESTSILASTSSADSTASLSTLIADAPFARSLRGFRVDDSALVTSLPGGGGDQVIYDSEDNVTRNWRLGPGGTTSGLSLIEIVGRETLRTERRTLPVIQRDLSTQPGKAGDIWPGTVLEDAAGQQYTIGRYQRVFGARGAHVTCEGALLADYGTSSISYALTQESAQSRQTGSGGGTTIVGGGGGGGGGDFVDWGNVTGKPPLVNTFNTRDGDVTLTGADVTGALGFTPSPETRQVTTPGIGLKGGGALTVDRAIELDDEIAVFAQQIEVLQGEGLIRKTALSYELQDVDLNNIPNANLANSSFDLLASSDIKLNTTPGASVTVALGDSVSIDVGDDVLTSSDVFVRTFNTRSGDVTLSSSDVTGALGFAPPPETREINTTDGLTGGGTLELNRTLGLAGESLGWHQFLEGLQGGAEGVVRRQGGGFTLQNVDLTSIPNSSLENSTVDIVGGSGLKVNTIDGGQATLALGGTLNLDVADDVARTSDLYTSGDFDTDFASKTTDDLTEGSGNLYHTTARVRDALTGGEGIALDSSGSIDLEGESLGWHQFLTGLQSGAAGLVRREQGSFSLQDIDLNNIPNSALQNSSVDIIAGSGISLNTVPGASVTLSLGGTLNIDIAGNLYTSADFDSDFAGKDTGDLSEGSNLYFTEARVRGALSGGSGISLDSFGSIDLEGESLQYHDFLEALGASDGFIRRQGGGFVLQEIDTSEFADADDLVTGVSLTEDTLPGETNLGTLQVTLQRQNAANFLAGVNLSHDHNASEVTAGTFDVDRIPTLGTGKVDFADQQLNTNSSPTFGALDIAGSISINGNVDVGSQIDLPTGQTSSDTSIIRGAQDPGGTYLSETSSTNALLIRSHFDHLVLQAGVNDGNTRSITLRSGENTPIFYGFRNGNVKIPNGTLNVSDDLEVEGNLDVDGNTTIGGTVAANALTSVQDAQNGGEVPRYDQIIDTNGINLGADGFLKFQGGTWLLEDPQNVLTQSDADARYLRQTAVSTDVLSINGYITVRQDGVNYYVATIDPFGQS